MAKKWWTPDRIGALIVILIGMIVLREGLRVWGFKVSPLTGDHIMLFLCSGALIFLGILLLFSKKQRKYENVVPEKEILIKMGLIFLVLFLYVALISLIGYTISSLISAVMLFRIFGSYSLRRCVVMGVLLTAVLYVVFVLVLEMPFPQGKLFI